MSDHAPALRPSEVSVMLLAAGRGKRMRELTLDTPKPLLKIGRHSLIEHHLIRLANLGFKSIIINIAYHAEKITAALGDGARYGLTINYSDESDSGALETAGGIRRALPLFTSDTILVVNSDIWTDFDFHDLLRPSSAPAQLVMVDNPRHNSQGDFWMEAEGVLANSPAPGRQSLTFSGIALYQTKLFSELPQGSLPLAPLLKSWIDEGQARGLKHSGAWADVGTPERLEQLNRSFTEDHQRQTDRPG